MTSRGVSSRVRRLRSRVLRSRYRDVKRLRIKVQALLTVLLVLTNVIGAGVLIALNLLITPGGMSREMWLALAITVPVYVLLAVAVGVTYITIATVREVRWALEERVPTMAQIETTMRLPWRITRVQFALWLGAALLFTVLALVKQPEAWLSTLAGVTIAGLVVSAIAFLITEFVMRPVAARALANAGDSPVVLSGVRRRVVLFWLIGTGAPALGLATSAIIAFTQAERVTLGRYAAAVLVLSGVLMTFGLLVTVLNARAVVMPIRALRDAVASVTSGELDTMVEVNDATELGHLQAGFNNMVAGLRERERIRDLFGRHVGEAVAQAATHSKVELGGQTSTVSVLMIDLIGSTTYATERSASDVVETLNRFFAVVVGEVDAQGGLVNKFMGDAVLAIFGSPVAQDDHSDAALAAARGIAARLGDEVPEIGSGIGVSTGEVVAGYIGASSRFEFTVIGDAVNAAARLTELAKSAPGHVVVTRRTVSAAQPAEQSHWTDYGSQTLRGRSTPTDLSILALVDRP